MIVDDLANWRLYSHLSPLREAFAHLESPEALKWPDRRLELDGERICAVPQGYLTRPDEQGKWEAHRRYVDIQYMVSGQERMGWAPVSTLVPAGTFDPARDVGFYTGSGDFLTVREGMFAVFFPHDAHMPCLHVDGACRPVRKIVIKVALEG